MRLRRATAANAPACAAIMRHWLDASNRMPGGLSLSELEATMRDGFPRREAYLAEDEEILSYLSLDPHSDHIRGLYVARPGSGVGRAPTDRVKKGRVRLSLDTHMPNDATHRFYEREGFVAVERDIPGSEGVAEQRMEWWR